MSSKPLQLKEGHFRFLFGFTSHTALNVSKRRAKMELAWTAEARTNRPNIGSGHCTQRILTPSFFYAACSLDICYLKLQKPLNLCIILQLFSSGFQSQKIAGIPRWSPRKKISFLQGIVNHFYY